MNRQLFIYLLLFVCFPIVLLAQYKITATNKLSYDDLKKGFYDNKGKIDLQKKYATQIINKGKNENVPIQIARGFYLQSLINEGNEAIRLLDSAIKYSKSNTNPEYNYPALAYFQKGFHLRKKLKFKEAIDHFLITENLSKGKNLKSFYDAHFFIGIVKAEDLGELDEGMIHYKNCYKFLKSQNYINSEFTNAYLNTVFALADIYKAKQQTDSASYFNKLGFKIASQVKNDEFKNIFILNEGANLVVKKHFKLALDSINKAKLQIFQFNDGINPLATHYYLGKAYQGLNLKSEAVKNFIKVDSIFDITKNITHEFTSGYHYLINHYKTAGNREKQLQYITQLMSIDSTLNINYKELTKKLNKEYDIPNLIAEKKTLIQSLETKSFTLQWFFGIAGCLTFLLGAYSYNQRQLKKSYQTRFDALMQTQPKFLVQANDVNNTVLNKIKSEIKISEAVLFKVLAQLDIIESNKLFLHPNITTQSLANELGTNNKYISTIVNEYKNKKFNDYLNDLRIDYAIETLKSDTQKRKYTIEALATEFGFNSAESFSNTFFKRTGLKPSYFIKELTNS